MKVCNKGNKPEPVLATRHSDNETINVTLTEDIAFEEGFEQSKLALEKAEKLLKEIYSHELGQSGDRSSYPCNEIEKYFEENNK